MASQIKENFVDSYGDSVIELDGWYFDINEMSVHSLDLGNFPETFAFRIHLSAYLISGTELLMTTSWTPTISVLTSGRSRQADWIFSQIEIQYREPIIFDGFVEPDMSVLFPTDAAGSHKFYVPVLKLTLDTYNRIIAIGQGVRGFPEGVQGHWIRMFYLSAGISTSNVFGDIAPLTTMARGVVALQTFISLILISLFLATLADHIAHYRNTENSTLPEGTREGAEGTELLYSEDGETGDGGEHNIVGVRERAYLRLKE